MENRSGHSVHFLERLDRASGDSADLALRMYHDPQLLRAVLAGIRIPDGFDRTAVSLQDDDKGPFMVADRAGRFITCLAPGMTLRDLHVIPNSQLLAHVRKIEEARDRFALTESLVGSDRPTTALMERILRQADDVTREEILALSAMQPAILPFVLFGFINAAITTTETNIALLRRKKPEKETRILRDFWERHWAAGHFALLTGMNGLQGFSENQKETLQEFLNVVVLRPFSTNLALTARLLWFIGKMGTFFLAHCKKMMLSARTADAWIIGYFGAMVIGLRHKKAKSQVRDAVVKCFRTFTDFPPWVVRYMLQAGNEPEALALSTLSALTDPEKAHGRYLASCRRMMMAGLEARKTPLPAPYNWQTPDEIPESLALTHNAQLTVSYLNTPVLLQHLAFMAPWLARCEAEDFYFPQAFYTHFRSPWLPQFSMDILKNDWKYYGAKTPVTADDKPGRNDPCSCGSGKKFKRCCGS